jgi:subtilase family serine protease
MPSLSLGLPSRRAIRAPAALFLCGASLLVAPGAHANVRLLPLHTGHFGPRARAASSQPLSPRQIRSAYSLPAKGARKQTIAVVSVFDDPYIQSDLAAYTKKFHLPACTEANGCFRVLNQDGQTSPLPVLDPSGGQWLTESALGVELSRGVCPSCKIMLVEANTTYKGDVAAAADAAAKAGATVIVTSVTPIEDAFDYLYEPDFSHPRTPVVAATGDALNGVWGYGVANFPSTLPNVIAVGGTKLTLGRGGRYGSEQAWKGTVSGCSSYNKAPSWQRTDAKRVGCRSNRAVADLSAMAAPGAIVRVSGTTTPGGPWFVATGTSVSAPIIAGVIGLAGSMGSKEAQTLYTRAKAHPGWFHDIISGTNSPGCKRRICRAMRGYDGPTGLGTPDGLTAFLPPRRR